MSLFRQFGRNMLILQSMLESERHLICARELDCLGLDLQPSKLSQLPNSKILSSNLRQLDARITVLVLV